MNDDITRYKDDLDALRLTHGFSSNPIGYIEEHLKFMEREFPVRKLSDEERKNLISGLVGFFARYIGPHRMRVDGEDLNLTLGLAQPLLIGYLRFYRKEGDRDSEIEEYLGALHKAIFDNDTVSEK